MGRYPSSKNHIYNSGVYNFAEKRNVSRSKKIRNGSPKLNHHMRLTENETALGWEITNRPALLSDIIQKFRGRDDQHFVLIVTSCLAHDQRHGPFQSFFGHPALEKFDCAIGSLSKSRMTSRRIQNLSSTHMVSHDQPVCSEEILTKLKEIESETNNQNLKTKIPRIIGYLERQQENYRIIQRSDIEKILNLFAQFYKISGGGRRYINIKNHGKRKIRYYKNGNPYIIIKGKKKKI